MPGDAAYYTEWRKETCPENLALLEFYGRYLIGQYQGMGEGLSLPSLVAAFEIGRVPRRRWESMTDRLLYLHGVVVECQKEK